MKRTMLRFLLIAVIIVTGIVLGIMHVKPPSADEASPVYQRMMANIEKWAAEPHPADTIEIEKVRSLILVEIEDMGLSPSVETESLTYVGSANVTVNTR